MRRRRRHGGSERPKAAIDMTSLIDLTFLLLVTFIITMPALEQGISIILPRAKTDSLPTKDNKATTITVDAANKIYLNNGNQMYALTNMVNEGTLRETFFVNQMRQAHNVVLPVHGDYLVDDCYTFEVGGASKSFDQIKDVPNSYLALDEVEYGIGNSIPLYLFGFLY